MGEKIEKINKNNEIRSFGTFEIRQIGEGDQKKTHIQGYAATFNEMSEDLGFREIIDSKAFEETDMSDVVLNFNHEMNMILARNIKNEGIGSLTLKVDSKGLFFDGIPTNTTYARDLVENMSHGIIGKCSFRFELDWSDPDAQTWDWDTGKRGFDLRTIHKIKRLIDVSVVCNPAYEGTTSVIYERSKELLNKEKTKAKEDQEERKKLELELKLLELGI